MRAILTRVVEGGIAPGTTLDLAFALRATNLAALNLTLVSVAGVGMALLNEQSAGLALAVVVCLAGYLMVLLVGSLGLHDAARFMFVAVACLHYGVLVLALGPASGIRLAVVAFVLYPVCAFTRAERTKTVVAYAAIVATFVAAEALVTRLGPLVPSTPAMSERANYFILVLVAVGVAIWLNYYQNTSFVARRQLDDAHRRIAELLANVLPPAIAARLEQNLDEERKVIADSHGEATVLFADLAGFSSLTRRLSPTHLVEVLDVIFSRFDEEAARYGIEKIKTIGDCYMAATGVLSHDRGVAAVEAMADFGLVLVRLVRETAVQVGLPLDVRVGISTGPVISGVIGRRKYSFDVWGDTVNLANRMEGAGIVGRVQVSEATYWRLQHAFEFETRGLIALKGDHHARAYLLVGRSTAGAAEGA